jgi:hypothetical protein
MGKDWRYQNDAGAVIEIVLPVLSRRAFSFTSVI